MDLLSDSEVLNSQVKYRYGKKVRMDTDIRVRADEGRLVQKLCGNLRATMSSQCGEEWS
jgi:hypothetical protein